MKTEVAALNDFQNHDSISATKTPKINPARGPEIHVPLIPGIRIQSLTYAVYSHIV